MSLMRYDRDEGEMLPEQRFAWGRIKSVERIKEWYISLTLFGATLFAATGYYNHLSHWRRFRFHRIPRQLDQEPK